MAQNNMDNFLRGMLEEMPERRKNDWSVLSRRVTFLNFFKFGLNHFNVYYVLFVLFGISGITGMLVGLNPHTELVAKHGVFVKAMENKSIIASANPNPNTHFKIKSSKTSAKNKSINLTRIKYIEVPITLNSKFSYGIVYKKQTLKNILPEIPEVPVEEIENMEIGISKSVDSKNAVVLASNSSIRLKPKWSVEIYSQPLFSDGYSSTSSTFNGIESEKKKEAYGANVAVSFYHLYIQAGLLYFAASNYYTGTIARSEQANFVTTNKTSEQVFSLGSFEEMSAKTDTGLNSASSNNVNRSFCLNNVNSYKCLDLPLIVGYKACLRQFTFIAKGGVIFGLTKNATGLATLSNTVVKLDKVPFISPDYTLAASLGMYYKIRSGLNFMVEPYFRKNVGSMKQTQIGILPSANSYGLKIGLCYNL